MSEKIIKLPFVAKPDVVNCNGIMYPRDVLEKAMHDYKEKVKTGNVYGSVGYKGIGELPMAEAAYQVVDVSCDDLNNIDGEIKILDTPEGQKLRDSILKNKSSLVIGMSLHGTLHEEKVCGMVVDYTCILNKEDTV